MLLVVVGCCSVIVIVVHEVLVGLIVSKPPVCIDRVCIGSQYATSVTAHKKYVT